MGTEAPKESISVGMNSQWIVILKKEDKSMSELLRCVELATEEGPGWSIFPLNHHIGLLRWLRPKRDKDGT